MKQQHIVIVGMARTPIGSFQGSLSTLSAAELGALAIRGAVERVAIPTFDVEDVIMGCVLPAGQGQAPARQAALKAGLPLSTSATTINKMCGSGMKAVMLAHDMLLANSANIIVAGGMESMTNTPYLLPKVRSGLRLGHSEVKDHMFLDGLEDAYDKGELMGVFAELCAERYHFTRAMQDEFAVTSLTRAQQAIHDGHFQQEIVPVSVSTRQGNHIVDTDEQPLKANLEKITTLKPAFKKEGTVTPANASSISDGAASLVMMSEGEAERRGIIPLARIIGHTTHAQEPSWFTTAPIGAIKKLLTRTQWSIHDVDLFEINEAFAVVTMAAMKELALPHSKVNVHGGACALGHPVGASGARVLVTLLSALKQHGGQRGIASLCIGGGEAVAVAVELI